MCGIAGILSLGGRPVAADEIERMCSSIVHRGPDDTGVFTDGTAGLGMRRLSIIDLSTGHQPISNEDGSVRVVFNGEIYNFPALRRELERRGHRLSTNTDTETIVHLYEDHGADLVHHLRGMFAFALWDSRAKRLLLGRDRLGIKPLYYAEANGRLLFASELKAILALNDVERELEWTAVNHLFTKLTTPNAASIVKGVRKLEPGHVLTAGPGQPPRATRYWDVSFQPDTRSSEADLADALRAKLDECVRMHMISDVPVGAFLSGGIDSSSVVAHMVRHAPSRVKTFAIGFSEASFNEMPYARMIAQKFGTDHHELVLEPDISDILEDLVWHLDEPFGDPSAIPTYMVSRMASEHVKVVLSGDGGDELFAGYDQYPQEVRERRLPAIPALARKAMGVAGRRMREGARGRNFLIHHSLTGWDRFLDGGEFFRRDARQSLLHPDVWAHVAGDDPLSASRLCLAREQQHGHWISSMQYTDLHCYLPLDILTKVDRMSMAHSLEARVPLLDHEFVELAATIPPSWNLNAHGGKRVFKQAMRGLLPDEILDRPKRGFAVPLASWFRGKLETFAHDVLLSQRSRERSILNPVHVRRLLELNRQGRSLEFQLWTLISFELWCRTFLDARRPAAELGATA